MLEHFSDPIQKNKILFYLNSLNVNFLNMVIASTANKLTATGKTIRQIAANLGMSNEQAVLTLIQNGGSEVLVFEKNIQESQMRQLLFHPLSIISSDGAGFSAGIQENLVHPRCFGSAPRALKLAKEMGLPLETVIKKLTSLPAKKAGINSRGEIKIDNFADIVIFNERNITDKATFTNPFQLPEGIDSVLVNGKIAYENKQFSGQYHGKFLQKA